jgi:hypothetical protein
MDDETKKIQPEIENLNLDEIDVEELEKRLELAASPVNELAVAGGEIRITPGEIYIRWD